MTLSTVVLFWTTLPNRGAPHAIFLVELPTREDEGDHAVSYFLKEAHHLIAAVHLTGYGKDAARLQIGQIQTLTFG